MFNRPVGHPKCGCNIGNIPYRTIRAGVTQQQCTVMDELSSLEDAGERPVYRGEPLPRTVQIRRTPKGLRTLHLAFFAELYRLMTLLRVLQS